ncbi:unnamed protein product [Dracunculus medinensis]|uniref:Uncharacterized protein n=1 Tax=Dracunculus medinensis TaxID=318479 RepID=A0A0N4U2C4_DRAME|nr:unnamed protein product [Dracunculus medinensis]
MRIGGREHLVERPDPFTIELLVDNVADADFISNFRSVFNATGFWITPCSNFFYGNILDLSILFEIFLGCCGLEHWRTLLRESKEVDKLRNIEKKHAILEESEQTENKYVVDNYEEEGIQLDNYEQTENIIDEIKNIARQVPIFGYYI